MATEEDERELRLLSKALILAPVIVNAACMAWLFLAYPRVMNGPNGALVLSPVIGWTLIATFVNMPTMIGLTFARVWRARRQTRQSPNNRPA